MKIRGSKRTTNAFALTAVAALCLGLATPAIANADENYADSVTTVDSSALSTIDATKDGKASLSIHKFKLPEDATGLPADGMELKADKLDALEKLDGIKFKIKRVTDIDLKTMAGWQKVAELQAKMPAQSAEEVAAALSFDNEKEMETANGVATFSDLPLGLYYVEEDLAGSSSDKKGGITPAAPFFITLPLTNTQLRNRWVYDVNTYPKNAITTAEKKVEDDKTITVGQKLTFTIDAEIPKVEKLKNYQIVDPLDKRLKYEDGETVVKLVGGSADLVKGTDYEIGSFKNTSDEKTYVTIEFTEVGRAKIAEARRNGTPDTKVQVQISATVTEIGEDGLIENQATLIPNEPATPWDKDNQPDDPDTPVPGTPTNKVISKFGKVEITKISTVNDKKLDGAKFVVRQCKVSNDNIAKMNINSESAFGKDLAVEKMADDNLSVKVGEGEAKSEFVTADGKVTIDGLRYNDWKNASKENEGAIDLTKPEEYGEYNAYCLVETVAPEGHELLPAPIPFLVTTKTMNGTTSATLPVTIKNVPKNGGFRLPVTGGTGITLAATAGGLLMAGGALVAVKRRRKNSENA
ncbi:SpaH/EbpB family LPXTG-anchored major pilin [Actinomycetaceae bacterium TAE3-ERU4]|nr:SpaH/EbpB family LPXTG-anchored major pilin [Actinomycetaceae bacterium TAE3-ERU4]